VEFARLCKLTGAQPYFAANLRSLPAQEFWRWVEYCNSPAKSTTLADLRAADGESAPLGVRYWGVGNESWGCGGNFDPEDYATEFNRYSAWLPGYGVPLALVGSGPNGGNVDWTRRFFAKCARTGTLGRLWGWAMHHYSWNASGGLTEDWVRANSAPNLWPVEGRITGSFGERIDPFNGEGAFHSGVDISASVGTPVVAPADGFVTAADFMSGYGRAVVVDHGHGLTTRYGHLASFAVVGGQYIHRGDIIGYVGLSGRSTGPHLHWSLSLNNARVDPRIFLGSQP